MYYEWAPYVPVAERRRKAAAEMKKLAKKGQAISPVRIEGRTIATTVWGKAWCANMERYSDFSNRLPRGRTYVRNGSVVDLQIAPGRVAARVSGSSIYRTCVSVKSLAATAWKKICADCIGGIDSLVELLQGRFAKGVMERLCRQGDGLFPAPKEITFDCSCPDGAYMCKHVAAVLYGIGARFDHQPELLFTLRQVDASELLSKAGAGIAADAVAGERTLATDDVGALFGLEMDAGRTDVPTKLPAGKPVRSAKAKPARSVLVKPAASGRARDPSSILLAALRKAGSLDNAAARAATGLDPAAVRPLLQRLVAEGHARVVGQKRGTRYQAIA
jgi:uncharacterized Zn finger protein